jgi:hypothetical protein
VHGRVEIDILVPMTKLLEEAIAKVRELSDEQQDEAADALFAHLSGHYHKLRLTPEQVSEVKRIQRDLREGKTRLATEEEVAALRKKSGL